MNKDDETFTNHISITSYFGLYESKDGGTVDQCYDADERVTDILDAWGEASMDRCKLVFKIRLMAPCISGLESIWDIAERLEWPLNSTSTSDFDPTATSGAAAGATAVSQSVLEFSHSKQSVW